MNTQNVRSTCAIVLGAAVWPDETASPTLKRRALKAAQLYNDGKIQMIIASGGLGLHPPTEAEMIRRLCVAAGVPDTAIFLEDRSTNTQENLEFSAKIIANKRDPRLIIVTDFYHLPRAICTARMIGLPARGAATSLRGTHLLRTLRSVLREIPAFAVYIWRNLHK